ncbi:YrbL family protein [Bartonella tamiae]|uniref:PhoP regulatory network protein YrbL n=1 Tax=Bartonella tamiae Th239 TaxID=1094558 RepID=J0R097_9HYPH|nr:YrbL family protein [Bartonella tamiae]EJF88899.1 hypothetical protein ME5_01450 [Bartonella tamiae Th239]EJF94851.1 hypothetical protein MEG_00432 [Bartonella tamiae Th307]
MIKDRVILSKMTPIFKGNARLVFVHPTNSDALIKVPRPEWISKTQTIPHWKKRFKPFGANSVNLHELREIIRINPDAEMYQSHMLTVLGFQPTDLGWGLVVRAERGENGDYAQPVAHYAQDLAHINYALEAFENWIKKTNAVLYDLNPWNLVVSQRKKILEIVVIDGIAEKSALQTRTYFPTFNKKKNLEVFERFKKHLEKIKNEGMYQ